MVIAAALATACTFTEPEITVVFSEPVVAQRYKTVTVSASQDAQTKTSYAGEKVFSWSEGDKISIYCTDSTVPSNDGFYTFTTSDTGASASFTGSIPVTAVLGEVAMYPANDNHRYSEGKYYFKLDGTKSYVEDGTHESADVPMYGVNDGANNYTFNQMTGAVKFTVNNIPDGVSQVKFTFTAASSKLSGEFEVTGSEPYTWNTAKGEDEGERSIVRYCPVTSNSFAVYVPYTQGTIWGDSTLFIQDYTGGSVGSTLYTQSTIGAIPVTRNKVTKLTTLSCGYRSVYGINWDSGAIETAENDNDSYPALKKMKATMDEHYFYILVEMDKTALTLTHDYDHYCQIYVQDEVNGSTRHWGSDKSVALRANIDDYGNNKDTNWWAVVGHDPAFSLDSKRKFDANVSTFQNSSFYEIRIPRDDAKTHYPLLEQTSNPIKIGLTLDDTYKSGGSSGHIYSPSKLLGILPSSGAEMYSVPQYSAPVSGVVPGAASLNKTYRETITETVNPERGLYRHNEYKFNDARLSSKSVSCESDKTLVLTIFYLPYYIESDLTSGVTDDIDAVFSNVRAAGKKAIVRFAYTWDGAEDDIAHEASYNQVKSHIASLKTVLTDNADVIYVVQAGFLGTWGEWYYTGSDFKFTRKLADYTSVEPWNHCSDVITELLKAVPSSRQVALRTPHYKSYHLYPANPGNYDLISSWDGTSDNERLALHNDAFLADATDMGTFLTPADRNLWINQSPWLAVGGENGFVDAANPTYCSLDAALETIGNYHYSYLNDAQSNNKIVKYWLDNDVFPIIRKALGYRLVLNSAKVTGSAWTSGTSLNFKLNISNTGSASVIYPRPCKLVLIHNGTATLLKDMIDVEDIRNIRPGNNFTYDFNVSLPQDVYTGDKLAIWMPDSDPNGNGLDAIPAYSIRLSSSGITWENGYNVFYTF